MNRSRISAVAVQRKMPIAIFVRLVALFFGSLGMMRIQAEDMPPRDWRHTITASDFAQTAPNAWTSSRVQPPFAFEELIYSWHLQQPSDSFRLYLQVDFGPSDQSDWL